MAGKRRFRGLGFRAQQYCGHSAFRGLGDLEFKGLGFEVQNLKLSLFGLVSYEPPLQISSGAWV